MIQQRPIWNISLALLVMEDREALIREFQDAQTSFNHKLNC